MTYGHSGENYIVTVGGQSLCLVFERDGLRLNSISESVEPYFYAYNSILKIKESAGSIPSIGITVNYGDFGDAVIDIDFKSADEMKKALEELTSRKNSPAASSSFTASPAPGASYSSGSSASSSSSVSSSSSHGHSSGSGHASDSFLSGYRSGNTSFSGSHTGSYSGSSGSYSRSSSGSYSGSYSNSYSGLHSDSNSNRYYHLSDDHEPVEELSISEKYIDFLRYPSETFEAVGRDTPDKSLFYFIAVTFLFAVVNTVICGFVGMLAAPDNPFFGHLFRDFGGLVVTAIIIFVMTAAAIVIYGLCTRIMLNALGSELEFHESMSVTFYSATAFGTVGLIPLVGVFLAPFYMLYLQMKGLCSACELETSFSLIASAVPFAVLSGLFYFFIMSGAVVYA
ncbi:Yip1 family protein [Methanomicrobium mobile]|uniref:Yip1 family protein n=1 Tax=Methanomicrobium mobile TaxID=2205 RepID=UPI0006934533|nr:Yip1 family protein [Methanomicrobium mobile]